ncbi:MAG: LexA family transcriptional regulator [Bacteroidota bacterium]|nr:LexA family transcriptional regulator [Bacteroidota bacterium]
MLQLTLPGGSGPFVFNRPQKQVPAEIPTESMDSEGLPMDLNQLLAPHQGDTFVMQAGTDLMRQAGILRGDLLLVDRTLAVRDGSIVIAWVNGQLLIRRYQEERKSAVLSVDSGELSPLIVPPHADEIWIWGMVTHVIHPL